MNKVRVQIRPLYSASTLMLPCLSKQVPKQLLCKAKI